MLLSSSTSTNHLISDPGPGLQCHPHVNDPATDSDSCQPATGTCNGQVIPTMTMPQGCNGSNTITFCTACTSSSTGTPPSSIKPTTAVSQIISQCTNCNSSPTSTVTVANSTDISPAVPRGTISPFPAALTLPNFPPVTTQSPSIMSPAPRPHPTSPAPTSTPTPSNPPRTTTSNAGAIAGGVVGGVLFLSLLTIGLLYFRRWRIQRRVAPSAEFMFLAGPGASYSRALNESPPPDPVLEKAYRSAEAQRRLDSNDTSVAAWEPPV